MKIVKYYVKNKSGHLRFLYEKDYDEKDYKNLYAYFKRFKLEVYTGNKDTYWVRGYKNDYVKLEKFIKSIECSYSINDVLDAINQYYSKYDCEFSIGCIRFDDANRHYKYTDISKKDYKFLSSICKVSVGVDLAGIGPCDKLAEIYVNSPKSLKTIYGKVKHIDYLKKYFSEAYFEIVGAIEVLKSRDYKEFIPEYLDGIDLILNYKRKNKYEKVCTLEKCSIKDFKDLIVLFNKFGYYNFINAENIHANKYNIFITDHRLERLKGSNNKLYAEIISSINSYKIKQEHLDKISDPEYLDIDVQFKNNEYVVTIIYGESYSYEVEHIITNCLINVEQNDTKENVLVLKINENYKNSYITNLIGNNLAEKIIYKIKEYRLLYLAYA